MGILTGTEALFFWLGVLAVLAVIGLARVLRGNDWRWYIRTLAVLGVVFILFGVAWYFSTSYSLGFVLPGTAVRRNSCDTDNAQPQFRLCWHSNGNRMTGGYRCGARTGLNGARDWERAIWTSR